MTKLDYTLDDPKERLEVVNQILGQTSEEVLTSQFLEQLADYLILCLEKQEKKERKLLTENRLCTITRRETSFEALAASFENGEDGIYNILPPAADKNILFAPKVSITKHDLETIPYLRQLRDSINSWDAALRTSSGRDAYIIKKALIEMRKDQYLIKQAYQRPIHFTHLFHGWGGGCPIGEAEDLLDNGEIAYEGVSLMDPKVVSAILENYSRLKQDSFDRFESDTWYLMQDFDVIAGKALASFPLYEQIVTYKIDGLSNAEIKDLLQQEFGFSHSIEYISALWKNKIPKLISQQAKEDFLTWYYHKNNLPMKKCSKCGQKKPMHNHFFSKNNTSKDLYYSICKSCRNKRKE